MRKATRESMEKLFTAKWNVPKAAQTLWFDRKRVKDLFS